MKVSWIRRSAYAVAALLLLLAVAAGVLLATFDANRYKTLAIDWMKAERQRTLVIDGPIELSFFPQLAVKVSGLRLSEAGRDDEFLAIDEAALALRVLPLLRRQWVIGRISARGVRASYQRDAKGVRNIDDWLSAGAEINPPPDAAPSASPSPSSSPSPSPAMRFDVSALQLDDLRLRVRDEMSPWVGEVVLHTFSSGRLANRVGAPVSLRASLQLTQPQALKLALEGRMTLVPDLDRNAVALTGLKLGLEGESAAIKALSLALEGALEWDGSALRAGPLQLAIKSATLGAVTLTPSTLALKRALFSPAGQRLELDELQLALAARLGSRPVELSLVWPQLVVDARQLKGSALTGRFTLGGPTAIKATFNSAAPSGNFAALRLPGLDLKLQGSAGARQIDGSLKAEMVLDVGRRAAAVEGLDLRAALTDPGLQPLQLRAQGSGGGDAKAAHWKLAGTLNSNRFETEGQADLSGTVPRFDAKARFDSLDLNKLLTGDKAAAATPAPTPAAADTPVPLGGLKALDGRFGLEAGALVFRHYRVADAQLSATLDKGTLRVARLAGRAWGGRFEGSGSAEAASQRIALKLEATGVDAHALLQDVAGKDLIEGTGHVAADLNTHGATIGALRANLAGSAAMQLRDGAIKGFNLARALRQAKAALSLKQDATRQASATEKTDFSELSMSAVIAKGVAHSDDLDLKSPFLRLGGEGRFDVGRGRIDYSARATLVDSSTGQGATELRALRGLTVPVLLSGPFDAIDWKIQWSGVAAAALQNKLKDKLRDKLAERLGQEPRGPAAGASAASAPAREQLKEQLKDRLRGLFK